jgi:enterochelin esterase-like enzyme
MIRKRGSNSVLWETAARVAMIFAASLPATMFGQGSALVSPEVHKDGTVTFRLTQAGAHDVRLALAGLETPLNMSPTQGVWSVTTAPLMSGTYWYSYLVDGKAELDPLNADVVPNYSYLNSVVRIPGVHNELWERAEVPHGELHHHFYESKIAKGLPGGRSEYYVYTPPGYEAHSASSYPTLYLLHGLSQGAVDWTAMGGANFILDNLIAQGKAKPMVVVMPLGYGDMAVAGKQPSDPGFERLFSANNALFGDVMLDEIVPRVEAEYRVLKARDSKAIAGLSMGGSESLEIGLNRAGKDGLGEFAWIGGFSAAAQFVPRPAATGPASKLRRLWISCGTGDALLESNRQLIRELQAKGYQVQAVERPGAHIWPVWQRNLADFVQLLF